MQDEQILKNTNRPCLKTIYTQVINMGRVMTPCFYNTNHFPCPSYSTDNEENMMSYKA